MPEAHPGGGQGGVACAGGCRWEPSWPSRRRSSFPSPSRRRPHAAAADVGQGFTVTPADLAFILKQIKIAEAHVANTTSATGPCGALVGTGPNQLASPLLSYGLRTVDGCCNNLSPGQERIGAADQVFPRLAKPASGRPRARAARLRPPRTRASYAQKTGNVFDSQPRTISNLIVDQTSTNPAAVAAAGFPVRTQGNPGVVPCTTDPDPGRPRRSRRVPPTAPRRTRRCSSRT